MQRIRPDYYEKFICIADKCPITCCQEWKIAVDADTNRRWKKILPPEDMADKKKNLSAYTMQKGGMRVIGLDENRRCPFLADSKLCRLVSAYGDKVLSKTCTDFPREVHIFQTHEEETLMPCCPAVLDLWKEEEIHFPEVSVPRKTNMLLFQIRQKIIERFQNNQKSVEDSLLETFYVLLELLKDPISKERIQDYFSEDTLLQLQAAIDEVELPVFDTIAECNELLLDLAVNYRKEGLYRKYLNPVAEQAEQLFEQYGTEEILEKWRAFQGKLQSYQKLLHNFLANEVFSDLLVPDGNLKQMVIKMQWIAMEYTAIRQSLFLKWLNDGCEELSYETVRDYVVVITRMMGYDEEDIYEYLTNSFEALIWDWGYLALIVGKAIV
ncbi:MAG: flagellin lysine-N-methylase [Lachnospiraceae bacterium]|nr:flagellin lysine-N-methylase [Lachnospiraceae bacterium]